MRRVLVETNDRACVLVDAPKPQYDDDDGDGEASTADDEKHLSLSNRENSPTRAGANLFGIACELRCIPTCYRARGTERRIRNEHSRANK